MMFLLAEQRKRSGSRPGVQQSTGPQRVGHGRANHGHHKGKSGNSLGICSVRELAPGVWATRGRPGRGPGPPGARPLAWDR